MTAWRIAIAAVLMAHGVGHALGVVPAFVTITDSWNTHSVKPPPRDDVIPKPAFLSRSGIPRGARTLQPLARSFALPGSG